LLSCSQQSDPSHPSAENVVMSYRFLLVTMGLVLISQAAISHGEQWWLAWPGLSLCIVGAGYLGVGPAVFGKRADGTLAWPAVLFLFPYFMLTWGAWHLIRILSREDCYNEVIPSLLIGRRPLPGELPDDVTLIVDLAAEFPESREVRRGRQYVSAPILDAWVPDELMFLSLFNESRRNRGRSTSTAPRDTAGREWSPSRCS
jgi:hypothetical protein